MRRKRAVVIALVFAVAASIARADAQDRFTAMLGWVPIGGAERTEVSGDGSASASLSGSRLTITGTYEGLPANATGAKLREGAAKGARGSAAVLADLRVSGGTSGTVAGDVRLNGNQLEALRAGRLYVEIYSEKGVLPDHATLFGWLASEASSR